MCPRFPLRVSFFDDAETWVLNDEEEVACNLEWFDSEDPKEGAVVVDAEGKSVRLKVESLEIVILELAPNIGDRHSNPRK